jgi:hypothetical protein
VLHASVSNNDGFFEETRVSSTQLNIAIWKNTAYLPLENSKLQQGFISKGNSIITG